MVQFTVATAKKLMTAGAYPDNSFGGQVERRRRENHGGKSPREWASHREGSGEMASPPQKNVDF